MAGLSDKGKKNLDRHAEVLKELNIFYNDLIGKKEAKEFDKSLKSFADAMPTSENIPNDPRFNAVHWGFELINLSFAIMIGFCWMEAYAKNYRNENLEETYDSHSSGYVSFFFDNCLTRIDAFRDKIALMVWSYYWPFNPEKSKEVWNYERIIDWLKYPGKYGVKIIEQEVFLEHLEKLNKKGHPHFKFIEDSRNLLIHRLGPRIEMYDVKPDHQYEYMVPLTEEKTLNEWRKKNEEEFMWNGVLFGKGSLKDTVFNYDEARKNIEHCLLDCLSALSGCLNTLKERVARIMEENNLR